MITEPALRAACDLAITRRRVFIEDLIHIKHKDKGSRETLKVTRRIQMEQDLHSQQLHEFHLQFARRLVQRVQIGVRHNCG